MALLLCLFLSCSLLFRLVEAYPPVIIQTISNIQVQGGSNFTYQLEDKIFRSNKANATLYYGLISSDGAPLPGWLSFDSANRILSGTSPSLADMQYSWRLTAADRDGEVSSQGFLFLIAIPCSSGLYRHFRLKVAAAAPGESAICSTKWITAQPTSTSFPVTAAGTVASATEAAFNITAGSSSPIYDMGANAHQPIKAFQQLLDSHATCDAWPGDSWIVSDSNRQQAFQTNA